MKRILVYSHDTFGLGNIRRMLEIARHLVDTDTDLTVLVLTGSPMLHAFRIPARIDYVKLPCLARDTNGRYGSRSLPLGLEETVTMRANLIRSALLDFRPDLLLVDKKPFGVQDELMAALAALPQGARRPRLALLLRDILDSPESTIPIWRRNGYFEAIERWYDRVLVVGSPAVYDLRTEYAMPPATAAKVRFCGYIAREPGRLGRVAQRAALGVRDDEPLVLVTPGGGEDGHALVDGYLRGLAALDPATRPRSHVVFGPEMGESRRESLARLAHPLSSVSVDVFCDDMMSLIGAADVVVSMGGYNTVCEVLSVGRRAVVVPRTKPGHEQLIRARRMAERGLLRCLVPDEAVPARLLQVVLAEIAAHRAGEPVARLPDLDGLDGVARAVLGLIAAGPSSGSSSGPSTGSRSAPPAAARRADALALAERP